MEVKWRVDISDCWVREMVDEMGKLEGNYLCVGKVGGYHFGYLTSKKRLEVLSEV